MLSQNGLVLKVYTVEFSRNIIISSCKMFPDLGGKKTDSIM